MDEHWLENTTVLQHSVVHDQAERLFVYKSGAGYEQRKK
jgi:hypothetical protein